MSDPLDSRLAQHPKIVGALSALVLLLAEAGGALAANAGTVFGP